MPGSVIKFDLSEVKILKKLLNRAASLDSNKLLDTLGVTLEGQTKERFKTKKDPDGKPWENWSEKYAKNRAKKPAASILLDSGRLAEDISFRASEGELLGGGSLPYINAQNFGYDKIPARTFFGVGKDDTELLAEDIETFIERETGGLF